MSWAHRYTLYVLMTVLIFIVLFESTVWKSTSLFKTRLDIVQPRRPIFYLHVGPHKTGTTFLQDSFCINDNFTAPFLQRDNLLYLGTCNFVTKEQSLRIIRHGTKSLFTDRAMPDTKYSTLVQQGDFNTKQNTSSSIELDSYFVSRIKALQNSNGTIPNVLMVYEDASFFNDEMMEKLKELLNTTWDVKVLVVHRFFHDWLLSVHNQIYQLHNLLEQTTWTKNVVPFDLNNKLAQSTNVYDALWNTTKRLHPARLIQIMYQRHFDQVDLVSLADLHRWQTPDSQGDPLVEYILCHWIQDATHACALERLADLSSITTSSRKVGTNSHVDFTFSLIAQEAHRQGFIPDDADRQVVTNAIEKQLYDGFHQTKDDLPLSCPHSAEMVQNFRDIAVAVDQEAIPRWSKDAAIRQAHELSFARINATKLCYVNATEVVANPQWQDYFQKTYGEPPQNVR